MFREHRERAPVVGEVTDAKPIVRDERLQRGREIVEERSRLKIRFERPPDGREADQQVGLRRFQPGAGVAECMARSGRILPDKLRAYKGGDRPPFHRRLERQEEDALRLRVFWWGRSLLSTGRR